MGSYCCRCSFFFFNDTATTEIYTLSLHDALPIFIALILVVAAVLAGLWIARRSHSVMLQSLIYGVVADRKSTRLNSSHANISYAVFCLKKKKINQHVSHDPTFNTYVKSHLLPYVL